MKNKLLFFFVLNVFYVRGYAQEMLGINSSNYSGNIGLTINPANVVGSPFSKEFNIFAMDFSIHNNYIYIPKGDFYHFSDYKGGKNEHGVMKDFYTETPDKNFYGNIYLRGPGVFLSGEKNGFAIHTAFRNNFSVRDLNYHLAKFIWDGFDYAPQQQIKWKTDPYNAVVLSFYELGFTYGQTLIRNESKYLAFAATLNFESGVNAVFIRNSKMNYIVPNSQLLVVNDLKAQYGHTITSEQITIGDLTGIKGFGGGLNIGVNYIAGRNVKAYRLQSRDRKKYIFKIGASLIDLGMISFNKDATKYSFENDSAYWPGIDTVSFQSMPYMDANINTHFTGSPNGGYDGNKFSVYLPAAFSLQFDYAISPKFYVNFTGVQRIPFSDFEIKRGNQLAITPRYETTKLDITLPISLYEYNHLRLGLSIRYKWFFAGTETFDAFTTLTNVTGLDFYFGIKLTNFSHQKLTGTVEDCFHNY